MHCGKALPWVSVLRWVVNPGKLLKQKGKITKRFSYWKESLDLVQFGALDLLFFDYFSSSLRDDLVNTTHLIDRADNLREEYRLHDPWLSSELASK